MAGGIIGVLLSIWLQTVIGALTVFYSLLVVTLFVPIVGGLYAHGARLSARHWLRSRGRADTLRFAGRIFWLAAMARSRSRWHRGRRGGISGHDVARQASTDV